MSDTIIVAVISLIGTFVGSFSGMKLMSYRIQQLEKKVEKHNNFAERLPVVENDIENIYHRLNDINRK